MLDSFDQVLEEVRKQGLETLKQSAADNQQWLAETVAYTKECFISKRAEAKKNRGTKKASSRRALADKTNLPSGEPGTVRKAKKGSKKEKVVESAENAVHGTSRPKRAAAPTSFAIFEEVEPAKTEKPRHYTEDFTPRMSLAPSTTSGLADGKDPFDFTEEDAIAPPPTALKKFRRKRRNGSTSSTATFASTVLTDANLDDIASADPAQFESPVQQKKKSRRKCSAESSDILCEPAPSGPTTPLAQESEMDAEVPPESEPLPEEAPVQADVVNESIEKADPIEEEKPAEPVKNTRSKKKGAEKKASSKSKAKVSKAANKFVHEGSEVSNANSKADEPVQSRFVSEDIDDEVQEIVQQVVQSSHELKVKADGIENDEECYICTKGGELVLCDGCTHSVHCECLGVKEDDLPEGDWFCPECIRKSKGEPEEELSPAAPEEEEEEEKPDSPVKPAETMDVEEAAADVEASHELKVKADDIENDTECYICTKGGELVLCDGCTNSAHCDCLGVKEDDLPEGDWFCPECIRKSKGEPEEEPSTAEDMNIEEVAVDTKSPYELKVKADDIENDEECYICTKGGELVLCDGCTHSVHCECLGVKEDDLPEGDWFCPECIRKSKGEPEEELSPAAPEEEEEEEEEKPDSPVKPAETMDVEEAAADVEASHELKVKSDDIENDTECYICTKGGELVLCDGCTNSAHCDCLGVKEDDLPEGDWFCPECIRKSKGEPEEELSPAAPEEEEEKPKKVQRSTRRAGKEDVKPDIQPRTRTSRRKKNDIVEEEKTKKAPVEEKKPAKRTRKGARHSTEIEATPAAQTACPVEEAQPKRTRATRRRSDNSESIEQDSQPVKSTRQTRRKGADVEPAPEAPPAKKAKSNEKKGKGKKAQAVEAVEDTADQPLEEAVMEQESPVQIPAEVVEEDGAHPMEDDAADDAPEPAMKDEVVPMDEGNVNAVEESPSRLVEEEVPSPPKATPSKRLSSEIEQATTEDVTPAKKARTVTPEPSPTTPPHHEEIIPATPVKHSDGEPPAPIQKQDSNIAKKALATDALPDFPEVTHHAALKKAIASQSAPKVVEPSPVAEKTPPREVSPPTPTQETPTQDAPEAFTTPVTMTKSIGGVSVSVPGSATTTMNLNTAVLKARAAIIGETPTHDNTTGSISSLMAQVARLKNIKSSAANNLNKRVSPTSSESTAQVTTPATTISRTSQGASSVALESPVVDSPTVEADSEPAASEVVENTRSVKELISSIERSNAAAKETFVTPKPISLPKDSPVALETPSMSMSPLTKSDTPMSSSPMPVTPVTKAPSSPEVAAADKPADIPLNSTPAKPVVEEIHAPVEEPAENPVDEPEPMEVTPTAIVNDDVRDRIKERELKLAEEAAKPIPAPPITQPIEVAPDENTAPSESDTASHAPAPFAKARAAFANLTSSVMSFVPAVKEKDKEPEKKAVPEVSALKAAQRARLENEKREAIRKERARALEEKKKYLEEERRRKAEAERKGVSYKPNPYNGASTSSSIPRPTGPPAVKKPISSTVQQPGRPHPVTKPAASAVPSKSDEGAEKRNILTEEARKRQLEARKAIADGGEQKRADAARVASAIKLQQAAMPTPKAKPLVPVDPPTKPSAPPTAAAISDAQAQINAAIDESLSKKEDEYPMTEESGRTGSSEEESDSEDEERQKKREMIPSWARGSNIVEHITRTIKMDPDNVFPAVEPPRLEEIFKTKNKRKQEKWMRRNSSGDWLGKDKLTLKEEIAYKKDMGWLNPR